MQYQIMQQLEGRKFAPVVDDHTNTVLIYNSSKEAAAFALELSRRTGKKHQPRPVKTENLWHLREQKRFEKGEYTPLIWCKEPWFKDIPGHFAHIGIKDKTKIAFTPNAEKGVADKQTVIAPGKYLQQFFGDVLSCEQIREYAMQHNTKFENNELKFARTPEEIQEVYKTTIGGSCFSGTTKANLYGSGDFAVAYITDKNGKITARAVCVPERKIYVKIYGDECRLASLLEKADYSSRKYGCSPYKGLRLAKRWYWQGFYADFGHPNLVDDPNNKEMLIIS